MVEHSGERFRDPDVGKQHACLAMAKLHKPMRPRIMGLMIPTMSHPKLLAFLLLLLSLAEPATTRAKETSASLLRKARAVLARFASASPWTRTCPVG